MNSPLGQPVVSDLAKQFIEALRFQQRVEQYSAMFSAAMVDQYARKQSQSPELFDDAGQARWVTIGSEQGTDGHRHGGHPVKIDSHGKMLTGAFAGQTMGEAFGGKKSEVASIPKKVFDWRKALSDYKASGFNGQHPTPAAIGHFRRQLTKGEPLTHPDGDITPEEFKEFDRAFVDQNKQFAKLNAGKSPEKPDSSKGISKEDAHKELNEIDAKYHDYGYAKRFVTPGSDEHRKDMERKKELMEVLGKHYWQRTKAQVKMAYNMSEEKHRKYVEQAIAEGKTVPENVLADYPDLKQSESKPGITLDTRANEAAKTGDQMGLFGDVNNVAKGKAKLDQVGTTKGQQMAMFDTKGDPDQMMMFDDGVTPDDRLMPEAKTPKPFEPVLFGSDSPKKSDEAKPAETGPIPFRERKEFAAKLADEGKLHSEIVDAMTARGVAASDARRLSANALGDKAQSKPPESEAKSPEQPAKSPELEAKPTEPPKPVELDTPATPSEKAADLFSSDIANGESPRAAAAAAQKKLDEDYEFARASDVRNAGEDLKGSARHKVNRWKNLEDAEKNGTAAELVTRDQLLKNEPHNLFVHADKNPLTALAMHYALKAFPAKPGTGKRGDHEKDRRQYLEAYKSVKEKAEELAKTRDSADVVKAIGEMQNHVLGLIKQYRGQKSDDSIGRATATDMYNQTANDLVSLHKALATNWRANKTGVAGRTNDFGQAAKERYGDLSVDNIADHAKDVMEGKSLNVTFGRDKKQSNRFDPSEMYVKIATRKGGRDLSGVTGDANKATKHMVESMGLRGIQWGNSVTDDERKHHASKAVEALTDLADTLGLHPKDIALDGKLGLAIGARGRGGAVAHYEPDSQVINLTRTSGVGSLAHEWAHGFDHALNDYNVSRFMSDDTDTHTIRDKNGRLTYESTTSKPEHMQKMGYVVTERSKTGIRKAMADLADAQKDYRNRLHKFVNDNVSGSKQQSYWRSEKEIFARTFERYVQHKLESGDKKNTYLAGIETKGHKFDGFWPTDDEVKAMAPAFDKLFEEYRKHKHGSADPVKYSRAEAFSAFTPLLIDRYIAKKKSAVDRYSNPHWSEQVRDNLGQWSTSSMPEVDESLLDNHKQSGPKLRHWLRDWSMQHLRDKRFTNQENGWSVLVNKDCIKKLSNQSTNSAVCLLVLDQLLEKAKLLESKPSSDNHPNELAWHYLVHPVKINGSLYAAKIDVVESGTHGHKAYSLHAIEIEKGPPQIPARAKHTTPALGDPLKISIDEIYKKINEEGGRYSANQENLWLAVTIEESTIDRYEWVESQHPRNPAGISSGGQFRSTKLRELPDTDTVRGVDKSHDFHHSKLPPDLQKQALNWSAELHRLVGQPMNTNYDEQLAKDAGKPMTPEQVQQLKEQRWKSVDKNEVRKLLDQMNQMDKQAKTHGIDLASHINASRLIPPELAMRLNGGRRFFDPSRVKAKAAPSQSSQQQTQQQPESKRWQDDPAKMAEYERRKGLTPSQSKSVDPNRVVPGTVVQNKNRPNHIVNENLASHINGEKKAIAATPEPEQSSFSPTHGLSSQAAGKVDRAAADTVGDGDQSKVDHFKGLIMDAWKIARDQAQEHNAALNTLQNLAGGSTFAARLSQHLARGGDVASVQGFDTVVDHARRHFPHLVGGADDAESGVVDMFRTGMKPVPQPWHDEVVDQAVQMAPQGFFDEYVPSAANASHDDPVPFSVVADCRHFVQCYWLREFKDYYALRNHPMHAAAPTEAQKLAGNFRMSHIKFQGLDITIETPKGRSRRPEWPTMKAHYGYFKRTTGADDENIDCFVGPDKNADTVYIIDQVKPNGQFDEHKVLVGFPTREAAIAAYRGSYSIGWRVGKVTVMAMDGFKKWLKSEESCKPAAAC